jgi:phosphatidylglycerophosphate synthase
MATSSQPAPALPSHLTDLLLDPVNRLYRYRLARFLLRKVKNTFLTPNEVTVAHTAVGVTAAFFVYQGHYLWAVLFYEIRTVLDCLDGLLARERNQSTAMGRTLDTIGDGISFNSLMIAGALRLIQDFRNYDPISITMGVFLFAFVAAHCGTIYQLMRRKLGSIINMQIDSVEMEWREHYEKAKLPHPLFLSQIGFWIDSATIRYASKEWYRKILRRRDAENWKEIATRDAATMNELACITRKKEFKRAVRATAFVSDDNILTIMSFVFLILSIFPEKIFPNVHPVLVAFSVGLVYAIFSLLLGLHFLHAFLHGVHKD